MWASMRGSPRSRAAWPLGRPTAASWSARATTPRPSVRDGAPSSSPPTRWSRTSTSAPAGRRRPRSDAAPGPSPPATWPRWAACRASPCSRWRRRRPCAPPTWTRWSGASRRPPAARAPGWWGATWSPVPAGARSADGRRRSPRAQARTTSSWSRCRPRASRRCAAWRRGSGAASRSSAASSPALPWCTCVLPTAASCGSRAAASTTSGDDPPARDGRAPRLARRAGRAARAAGAAAAAARGPSGPVAPGLGDAPSGARDWDRRRCDGGGLAGARRARPAPRVGGRPVDFAGVARVATRAEQRFSRGPVYRGERDNVVGVLYAKDLLGRDVSAPGFRLEPFLRPPAFVPLGMRAGDVLGELRRRKVHLALVVDEYGGIAGLVTMEDLLEELFG